MALSKIFTLKTAYSLIAVVIIIIMGLQQLPFGDGGVVRELEHPFSAQSGQAPVAAGAAAISPSVAPTSGVIEDGVFSNIASAAQAAFLPEHFVPIALAPLNYNGKFGSEDHWEKEKSNTEGANDCGCHEPQVVPVVMEPQPTPSNNNSASFSVPPFTIVGPVGFIIIVMAIYFFYRMLTSGGNQQQGSSSTTQPSANSSAPLAGTHVISV